MATSSRPNSRMQVGSAAWIAEERKSALQIAESEVEEFTYSVRNELDWLNEHMAEVFSENQLSVAEMLKTPGKLRGKTPRTARRKNPAEARPLSDIFSSTPKGVKSPFSQPNFARPTFQVAEDPVESAKEPAVTKAPITRAPPPALADSGYFGSQSQTQVDTTVVGSKFEIRADVAATYLQSDLRAKHDSESDEGQGTETSFQTAKEEQTVAINLIEHSSQKETVAITQVAQVITQSSKTTLEAPRAARRSSARLAQQKPQEHVGEAETEKESLRPTETENAMEDVQSPSEGSSPIRAPLVRKSSLSFASLPAREPLTKQSIGNRISRTSHLDQSRTSHYGRSTGGKSLGNFQRDDDEDLDDDMDVDAGVGGIESDADTKMTRMHNKTSTQRLQDQISKLGQSQSHAPRPSKSISNVAAMASQPMQQSTQEPRAIATDHGFAAPGAFPDDEDDDWIGPPTTAAAAPSIFSPRSALNRGITADVMENIHGKTKSGAADFNGEKQQTEETKLQSPLRGPAVPEKTRTNLGHLKSASTTVLVSPSKPMDDGTPLQKAISVSNPANPRYDEIESPPKSPARSFRDSPLKAAKDKMSSILKTSRNLFASSAAASAAAKGAALPQSPGRLGGLDTMSFEDLPSTTAAPLYPSLPKDSPSRVPVLSKTPSQSSLTDKKREMEVKQAMKMDEKLGKLREQEAQKAKEYSQLEHERVAAMEKAILAKKEQERQAKAAVEVPRPTRTSPRKTKAQLEAEGIAAAAQPAASNGSKDVDMTEAPAMEAPRPRETIKRPVKPAKESLHPMKQAPVVIRVDTGSQRNPQRSMFHPTNTTLASNLSDSLGPAVPTAKPAPPPTSTKPKANTSTIRPKASTSSLKSVSSTTGKLKVLEAAAKKKEQEDREAQRKQNLKLEIERKRAALQQDKQLEQQRQNELERQREKEHAAQMNSKRPTAQQALEKRMEIERAKQQRPPAPAPRSQFGNEDKPLPAAPRMESGPSRPPSRMESTMHRPDEDFGRSVAAALQNMNKAPPKRPLPQDTDEAQSRPGLPPRNPPSSHAPDAKRRKTIEDADEEMHDSQARHMAPPIRQSAVRPKQSLFSHGYANVPQQTAQAAPLLHKATLNAQHAQHAQHAQQMQRPKPAHPMDTIQTSKAPISFAPNPSQQPNVIVHGGPSQQHKTPARPPTHPAAKSSIKPTTAAKASPKYQNGDSISLPEIPTDSEDSDSDTSPSGGKNFPVPSWADSPALRQGLVMQETIDPVSVFGLPGEIRLEEVFANKPERLGRFRARTSSANWDAAGDRLTEEEVRRDLAARERLRREGGWTFGLS